jgi:hypothetical protein
VRDLSSDESAELARRLAGHGLLDAVAYHRRATGSSLPEAVAAVRASRQGEGAAEIRSEHELSADLLAIGPFRSELVPLLEYPNELWANVAPGATIVQKLFDVYQNTSEVVALAAAFAIDPCDFNAHALDASRADLTALHALDAGEFVERFLALRGAGFRFYFYLRPSESADDARLRE